MSRARRFSWLVAGAVAACAPAAPPGLTPADRMAIDSLQQAYVSAWLRDDTLGVLATFAVDGMIIPPGSTPRQGRAAIRAWWWPEDGSHTTITAFTLTAEEVEGGGDWAFARGLSTLAWRYTRGDTTTEQHGRNIGFTILRRGPGGWRIARQAWGPSLPERQD